MKIRTRPLSAREISVLPEERLAMRRRPNGKPAMTQTWRDLIFLHYPLKPEVVQRLLPAGLIVDVFPDDFDRPMAWIGVVAFRIEDIRVFGMPPMPGLGSFNEVNVRTYAHLEGKEPAVYFFSLDGGPLPTRLAGRAWYKVPYFRAKVRHHRVGTELAYESRRTKGTSLDLRCEPVQTNASAEPGSLAHFLTDRYMLYSTDGRRLWKARVSHAPYELGEVIDCECRTDLPLAAGLPQAPFTHVCWCPKVEACFYAPTLAEAIGI